MTIIIIEGKESILKPVDLNRDGVISDVEVLSQTEDFTNITQPSETKEALQELNEDRIEQDKRMSTIDFKSNLKRSQIAPITAFDTLPAIGFMPTETLFVTRSYKRNSVSIEAHGRKDMVDVSIGQRQHTKEKIGLVQGLKNLMGAKKTEEVKK